MFSRVATGRKMGYAYEIHGTKGAIRFDQEDQNALWLYRAEGPEAERGFRKILIGPAHPDYLPSVRGRGMARAIRTRSSSRRAISWPRSKPAQPVWPTFRDGLAVWQVIDATLRASAGRLGSL
jgi:predicted dehydrogenase